MGETYKPTPEEMGERTLSDAELLKGGGLYKTSGRLEVTGQQQDDAREEMKSELLARDLEENEIYTLQVAMHEYVMNHRLEWEGDLNNKEHEAFANALARRFDQAVQRIEEEKKAFLDSEENRAAAGADVRRGDNLEDPGDQSREE